MSETTEKPKNPYQIRRERMAAAIKRWQESESESDHPLSDAGALEDLLLDEDLLVLPRAVGYGKFRVLVDGEPAPYVNSDRPSGPVDAEQAAEMFLIESAKDEDAERAIVVRPATDVEMSSGLFGDTTLREDPIRFLPDLYTVVADPVSGHRVVTFSGGRHVVQIELDRPLLEMLAAGLADEVKTQGSRS